MLKVHYKVTSHLIKDRSRGPRVSGQVMWCPVIPAPTGIPGSLGGYHFIVVVLICMMHWGGLGAPFRVIYAAWRLAISSLIRPHRGSIPGALGLLGCCCGVLSFHFLTIYCVLPCVSVMHHAFYLGHDVLWRVRDPISQWMMAPDPSSNHWEPGTKMLKVHCKETLHLIKDRS